MSLHPKGGFYQISQLWEVGCADVALLLRLQSLDNVNKVWEFINCVPLIGQSAVKLRVLRLFTWDPTVLYYEALPTTVKLSTGGPRLVRFQLVRSPV